MSQTISINEAAKSLSVHRNTIMNMMKDGRLTARYVTTRTGRTERRVIASEIEKLTKDAA